MNKIFTLILPMDNMMKLPASTELHPSDGVLEMAEISTFFVRSSSADVNFFFFDSVSNF